ncbi:MAG: chemotaxis protein CheW [Thermoproteota archaeon]
MLAKNQSDQKMISKIVVFSITDASTKKKMDYGVDIEQVQEMGTLEDVTRVPGAPPHVRGVMNLRGKIITIVDMKKLFDIGSDPARASERIIVAQVGQSVIGLLVDDVDRVIEISASDIEPAPAVLSETAPYIKGIVKLEGSLYVLLDLRLLLTNEGPVTAYVHTNDNGKSSDEVRSNQKVAEAR